MWGSTCLLCISLQITAASGAWSCCHCCQQQVCSQCDCHGAGGREAGDVGVGLSEVEEVVGGASRGPGGVGSQAPDEDAIDPFMGGHGS